MSNKRGLRLEAGVADGNSGELSGPGVGVKETDRPNFCGHKKKKKAANMSALIFYPSGPY